MTVCERMSTTLLVYSSLSSFSLYTTVHSLGAGHARREASVRHHDLHHRESGAAHRRAEHDHDGDGARVQEGSGPHHAVGSREYREAQPEE